MKKTNAARLLEGLGIDYELLGYRIDEEDLSAEYVAKRLTLPVEQVFKTIVARGEKSGIFVSCIPGCGELDLKKSARLTGNKKVELIPAKEVLSVTGYLRGGCSPLAMKKHYPTFVHESALACPFIVISAGVRGKQIKLAASDLITATGAVVADLLVGC